MIKVYGADICIDCRNLKVILKQRNLEQEFEFIDITESTDNLKAFLEIRDHEALFEEIRNWEGGAIGIPCFVMKDGMVSLDVDEVFLRIGQPPVKDDEIVEKRCE